jgi:hypothetical protein
MLVYTYSNRPEELRLTQAGRTQTVRIRPPDYELPRLMMHIEDFRAKEYERRWLL